MPPDKWHALLLARRSFLHTNLPYDCRELLRFVEDAEQMYGKLGFNGVEDLVRRGLELDPQQVNWAVDGLRQMKPNEATPYLKAPWTIDAITPDLKDAHRPKNEDKPDTL